MNVRPMICIRSDSLGDQEDPLMITARPLLTTYVIM